MKYINKFIKGVPYAQSKPRGDKEAPKRWTRSIIEQTEALPTIDGPCSLRVTFLFPPDKYPRDFPYGPDLDNFLKRFQDALQQTVFRNAPGGDSCVVSIHVSKTRVNSYEESGASLEIVPAHN